MENIQVIDKKEYHHRPGILSDIKDNGVFSSIRSFGLLPVVKSMLVGDNFTGDGLLADYPYDDGMTTQNIYQWLTGVHTFNRKALIYLVETGYANNPVVFGIIQKIILAQRNIKFVPYKAGRPNASKSFDIDINFALLMYLTTGTVFFYSKEIIGFPDKIEVLNTLNVIEINKNGNFSYKLDMRNGTIIDLDPDNLVIVKTWDLTRFNTNMGLSFLQIALMPMESLREMYIADTSMLKNKGVDVLITNGSEDPIKGDEAAKMDKALNERIAGARKSGGVATSTAKLQVLNIGRTIKDLALWDGYKIKQRDICNVLQVDSGQFNDPDNKKYANVQESNRALYNDCVIPFTKVITENKDFRKMVGYDVYLDLSGIDCLQEAQSDRADKANTITNAIILLNTQVQAGILTADIAVKILVSEWNFDEEEAREFISAENTKAPAPLQPGQDGLGAVNTIVD